MDIYIYFFFLTFSLQGYMGEFWGNIYIYVYMIFHNIQFIGLYGGVLRKTCI